VAVNRIATQLIAMAVSSAGSARRRKREGERSPIEQVRNARVGCALTEAFAYVSKTRPRLHFGVARATRADLPNSSLRFAC
jgi:hypothetical protein